MNRQAAITGVVVAAVGIALLATWEARSQEEGDRPSCDAPSQDRASVPPYSRPKDEAGRESVAPTHPADDPLLHPSVSPLLLAIRRRGADLPHTDFENALKKACIAFYCAAETAEVEREAREREEAADNALLEAAESLLEVTKDHPGTRAAAKAREAFKASGLAVSKSGIIYDPETTINFGFGPIIR
jgi:hypothetical protein